MNPLTINGTTFLLTQGITPVLGTVTYAGTTATFSPSANLASNTLYTATITTGAKDLAGNAWRLIMSGVLLQGSQHSPPVLGSASISGFSGGMPGH